MPDVRLLVNGSYYGGWQTVRISLGMEQIAGEFSLTVSERFPGRPEAWKILPGDECRVLIGNQPVITGYVDDVEPGYDRESHTVAVMGRDRTGDLVDCSAIHKTGEWRGVTLDRIVSDICAPFGIKVTAAAPLGAPFKRFSLQEGETAFEAIERATRMRGLLPMSNGTGWLLLTRAGTNRINTALVKGKNVERASGTFSQRDRYSRYIIKGQSPGSDDSTPEHNARTMAETSDESVKRYRPLIVISEQGTRSEYREQAVWERNVRAGRGSRAVYTATGWHHPGGLWLPNNLVRVEDDFIGFAGDLILARVTFTLDEASGSLAELDVCRPEAFDVQALPERPAKKGETGAW